MDIIASLCTHFGLKDWQVKAVVELIDDGNTIPFIARYRKEQHGSLDDQVLHEISERLQYLRNLTARKEEVTNTITEQGNMTDEIAAAIAAAQTLTEVEDIYRPFKPKRRTRATIAKEKGLEPLANQIYAQSRKDPAPLALAEAYINADLGVETAEDALAGACDIIAEQISDNPDIRRRLRNMFTVAGEIETKPGKQAKEDPEHSVYAMYYEYKEPVNKIADHRVLAIDRGEREGYLSVSVSLEQARAITVIEKVLKPDAGAPAAEVIKDTILDAYARLIEPSVEREIRSMLTEKAAVSAIRNFSVNLQQLLMQPPVKGHVVMGLDPGYRTGCKVAVVDALGRALDTGVIYPAKPFQKLEQAKQTVSGMIKKYGVTLIAIGNGTASKETEMFAADLIKTQHPAVQYMVVSEAGASVYSASKLAAEEFPEYDVSLRSAVSIARRLQDPLAELVKIDPKAIGVGQYQHDMPKKQLEEALIFVVEDCVNKVGVDLNTASVSLLARVSGVNAGIAKNIVAYRDENGAFTNRRQLLKVAKLGKKAYEQCAGFLRISDGETVLDATGVHPESYKAAKQLLTLCGVSLEDAGTGNLAALAEKAVDLDGIAGELGIGVPTLQDIIKELMQPGRDPRDELPAPMLRSDVMDLKDLKAGMELKGTVRNVIDFGAFVDIGVHQDGLVHISQITNKFIRHPSEVLKVGDIVTVWVLAVDPAKKRISLTMKQPKPVS